MRCQRAFWPRSPSITGKRGPWAEDTKSRWGIEQTETYIRQLSQHIELIAARPAIGRACPEVRPGYHRFPSGTHLLFYRVIDDVVDIVRILHERMDFQRHL
ncbi:type II toxin-antitoxin system RelE/ParE family toxin [Acidisoma sp. L85]|uniref:type II toxin-antitoxin system RelE/ParE family toxin n=1 Tax=Acidisoma sp. L85 TaxID=1641850 RepID=UPI00131C6407